MKTDPEIALEIARLDEPDHAWEITPDGRVGYRYPAHTGWIYAKPYLTSRDAIVPVITKVIQPTHNERQMRFNYALYELLDQDIKDKNAFTFVMAVLATPRQLCLALLK